MADLARHFQLVDAPSREYSIEIDPRTVDADRVAQGFSRAV